MWIEIMAWLDSNENRLPNASLNSRAGMKQVLGLSAGRHLVL
jgi:hypothetical protein